MLELDVAEIFHCFVNRAITEAYELFVRGIALEFLIYSQCLGYYRGHKLARLGITIKLD